MNIEHDTEILKQTPARSSNPGSTTRSPRWLLLGNSAAIRALRAEIARIAPMDATLLIAGERGTCKELYAAEIHRRSGRSGPFVVLDHETLLNATLRDPAAHVADPTGHTGNARLARAPFDYADGGTIFLPEVAELAPELQSWLVETFRLDGPARDAPKSLADVRVIASTSHEPVEATREGRLREDLYELLNELTLNVPPLRERDDDVVLLAKAFVDSLNRAHGTARRLDERGARTLMMRKWPGNARELRRAIEQSYLLADGFDAVVRIADASDEDSADIALHAGVPIAAMERKLIELTLAHFHGDKRRSAAVLGISVRTLYNRLRQYRCEAAES